MGGMAGGQAGCKAQFVPVLCAEGRRACLPIPSLPTLQRAELNEKAEAVSAALTRERLSNTIDTTGTTIGKR